MRFVIVGTVAAAAAVSAAGVAAPANAADWTFKGVYGNLGWADTNAQGASTQSITGRVGGRFGPYLGVEGEVTAGLGAGSRTFDAGGPNQRTIGVKQALAGAVYGVGYLPLGPNLDLLGRIGYGASRYDVDPTGLAGYHANEHGMRWGFGGQYFLDGANGLRVDWTRHQFDSLTDPGGYFSAKDHADVWSVSFAHKF